MNNSSLPSVCTGFSGGIGHDDFDFSFNFNTFTAWDMDIGADGWVGYGLASSLWERHGW
jgi:hypothetical protein